MAQKSIESRDATHVCSLQLSCRCASSDIRHQTSDWKRTCVNGVLVRMLMACTYVVKTWNQRIVLFFATLMSLCQRIHVHELTTSAYDMF